MKRALLPVLALALVCAGCVAAAGVANVKSLRHTGMLAGDDIPPVTAYKGEAPGTNQRYPRSYAGAPPQVPHDIGGLQIERDANPCINCHDPANAMENVPYSPPTHMVKGQISNARYQCNMCHVPQADVKPLVGNENDMLTAPKAQD
jgi:cytochrome c-type protein NapB